MPTSDELIKSDEGGAAVVDLPTSTSDGGDGVVAERKALEALIEKARQERTALSDEQKAKAEADKARALKDMGDFETLYNNAVAELEPVKARIAEQDSAIKAYESFVTAFIEPRKAGLDSGVQALLDKIPPLEQANWLVKYEAETAPKAPKADRGTMKNDIASLPRGNDGEADSKARIKAADEAMKNQNSILQRI